MTEKLLKEKAAEKARMDKKEVTDEYLCYRDCRNCPFPGAKCVDAPGFWDDLQRRL